ncbi:MAG: 4Fe-4S binding protein [Methanoregulaceae archaeon]
MGGELRCRVGEICSDPAIGLFGIAPASRWDTPLFEPWVPPEFRPSAIWPEVKSVIVIGIPVHLPVLETAPSIWYHELYRTVNQMLDMDAYRIACCLNELGFPSVSIPRDGYGSLGILRERPVVFFSHRHAAFLAGLGNFGINNTLLTRKYGPRIRFASVFTAAEIPPDPVLDDPLCTRCMRCVQVCPVRALPGQDYPEGLTEKKTCAARSEALFRRHISPCGLCIRVCPVGEDRQLYRREDPDLYREDPGKYEVLHRAWDHVRSYGGG